MKKRYIFLLILILFSVSVVALKTQQFYILNLNLNNDGSIDLEKIYLSVSGKERDLLRGPYILRLVSLEGRTLYMDRFDFEGLAPPAEWFDENGKQIFPLKGLAKPVLGIIQPISKVTLVIPYFKEAREIQIYNPERELALRIDLAKFCEGEGCLREGSFFSRVGVWIKRFFG